MGLIRENHPVFAPEGATGYDAARRAGHRTSRPAPTDPSRRPDVRSLLTLSPRRPVRRPLRGRPCRLHPVDVPCLLQSLLVDADAVVCDLRPAHLLELAVYLAQL